MGLWYFEFLVGLVLIEIIWSLPLGCPYNGTSYGEGETVRTEEPCLSCVCERGALQCNLRVCSDHPDVPPPGCFFLHKPNDCCPQLFCEEENFNPVQLELQTGFKLENNVNVNDCSINGSIYAEGSALASSRACEYCYCSEGEMKCIKPRCLRSFEGCKASYEKSSCCPTFYDCRNADSGLLKAQIENFVLASADSKGSDDSSRTLSNLKLKPEKKSLPEIEPTEEDSETTTAKETVTEETTFNTKNEATTFFTEDYLTSTGFQTAKTEHFNRGPTTIEFTEETTLTAEATTDFPSSAEEENREKWNVRFRNKLNISEPVESSVATVEESRNSSFQEVEEYDSYDYGEPQLPPSLPNLVIFPFVAADAVIKDETHDVLDIRDSKIEIKRVDVHPVFYKDYFSPPEKTEGGFVPKEPSKSSGPLYDQSFYRTRGVEGSDTGQKTEAHWVNVTSIDGNVSNLKSIAGASFEALADINPPSDNVLNVASQETPKGPQTKKPVTVTYKSVVVDFYPNYLITTTRAHPNVQFTEKSWSKDPPTVVESFDRPPQKIKNLNTSVNNTRDAPSDSLESFPPKKTRETPTGTSVKPPSLNDFLKTFLPGETTTTTLSTKHKYSSKIKGQGNAVTAKTVGDAVTQKVKAEMESGVTFDSNTLLNILMRPNDSTTSAPIPGKSKIYSSLRKQIKEGITELPASHTRATATPEEVNNGQVEFFQFLTEETTSSENVRRGTDVSDGDGSEGLEEGETNESCVGALLKLAGCNIYGMMYRVGKVINELSGPCSECLCTDLGVQCRPLEC